MASSRPTAKAIVPRILPELLGGDAERTDRVMKKFDIAQVQQAAAAD